MRNVPESAVVLVCTWGQSQIKARRKRLEAGGNVAINARVCIAVQRGDPDIGRSYKSLVKIEVTDKVYVVERHL